jgi:hypothetical protein
MSSAMKRPVTSLLSWLFLCGASLSAASVAKGDAAGLEFFEKNIRPLLADRCYECHSAAKSVSKGGLRLDSKDAVLRGGDNGAAVVPANVEKSLLVKAVRYTDPDLAMPPKKKGGKLTDAQVALLEQWVDMGAPMPADGAKLSGLTDKARNHWAFRPVRKPAIPAVKAADWVRNPIDAFVLAKLESKGLVPTPAAGAESYLRRVSYDLVGLPPSAAEAAAFKKAYDEAVRADASARADGKAAGQLEAVLAAKVDDLLASPHYGERWARHWMDTARYSDTNGKLDVKDSFEEYRYAYAWTYRDYVIDAFNADKPYDQFIVEQLAADRLPGVAKDDPRLAALGFITVGKRFAGVDDVIDERIDTTTRAFLGLSVACARCHDHKFDPIPAADYFSMHGVFASVREPAELPEIAGPQPTAAEKADFAQRLEKLQAENAAGYYQYVREMRARYDGELAGRLLLSTVRRGSAPFGDYSKRYDLALMPDFDLMKVERTSPITGPLARVAALPAEEFAAKAPKLLAAALADKRTPVNPLIAAALRGLQPKSVEDVAKAYQAVFHANRDAINAHVDRCAKPGRSSRETDPAIAQLASYPWPVPDVEDVTDNEDLLAMFNQRKYCAEWQTRPIYGGINNAGPNAYFRFQQINALRLMHPGAPRSAMVIEDIEKPKDSRIQLRGDRKKLGDLVPRRFLDILTVGERKPFAEGSGRLELARAIASKSNPMTPRVAVNRLWLEHFGEGFVATPDDFGNMAEKPTHPELLDYLSAELMEHGWSLKHLHRLMVLSATYRQSSNPALNPLVVARGAVDPMKIDEGNRLLWHGLLRRLDFEAIRDSMIAVTGRMDTKVGGHPVNITDEPYSYRRSLYGYVDRRRVSETLSQFDYSDPDSANTHRGRTVVPQQALFFMNNPLAITVARGVAARADVAAATSDEQLVTSLYQVMFQRIPSAEEMALSRDFLAHRRLEAAAAPKALPKAAKNAKAGKAAKAVPKVPAKASEEGMTMMMAEAKKPAGAMMGESMTGMTAAAKPKGAPTMMMAEPSMMAAASAESGKAAKAGMMTTEVMSANLLAGVRNLGDPVQRKPLTPVELLVQAMMLSNEFIYVN